MYLMPFNIKKKIYKFDKETGILMVVESYDFDGVKSLEKKVENILVNTIIGDEFNVKNFCKGWDICDI